MKFISMSLAVIACAAVAAPLQATVLSLGSAYSQYNSSSLEQLSKIKPVAIKWSVPGCPPCIRMEPIFHSIANEFGDKVIFISDNAQSYMNLIDQYGIERVPTFLFLKDGSVVGRFTGDTGIDSLRGMTKNYLGL
ncbi:TPA: hypothetical protein DDZ86_02010 [Candidatus Dependentiae bacterium]|nr:MAG: Thioredoxin [candidate division TM6 bacterium GW2011_GWF2_43_87]HBL98398.1 hypothetical protein [Candidatus Dependentiae bacterium]